MGRFILAIHMDHRGGIQKATICGSRLNQNDPTSDSEVEKTVFGIDRVKN